MVSGALAAGMELVSPLQPRAIEMQTRQYGRRLRVESLERRQLLAADGLHNFLQPMDVNDDHQVTPIDALAVINFINRDGAARPDLFLDVNDDASVAPIDALRVVNYLNRQANTAVADQAVAQMTAVDGVRLRAEMLVEQVGDQLAERFQVRLQNGIPNQTYPVLVDGTPIGSVVADARGRGVFELDTDGPEGLAAEIADKVWSEGAEGRLVHLEGVGGVLLRGEGEPAWLPDGGAADETPVRLPDFGMLPRPDQIAGPVYAAGMQRNDRLVGGVYATPLDGGIALGVSAAGFRAGESYEVAIDGVTIANVEAGRFGVVSWLYNSTQADAGALLNPLPEISAGSVVTIGMGDVQASGTFRELDLPFVRPPADRPDRPILNTQVATLDGETGGGVVTYTQRGEGYYLGIAARGAERSASYDVIIDGVPVASVQANRLGFIVFRQRGDDAMAAGFPVIDDGSVVRIGDWTGVFKSVGERLFG